MCLNRHHGISITIHVRARMYHYRDVPYIPYLPTTVATTLFSLFRSELDFCRKQESVRNLAGPYNDMYMYLPLEFFTISILTKDLIMVISSMRHRFAAINEMNIFDQSVQAYYSYL